MKKNRLTTVSRQLGFRNSYFHVMKRQNPKKLYKIFGYSDDCLVSFDEYFLKVNVKKAINEYVSYVKSLISEMTEILDSFEPDKKGFTYSDYGRMCIKCGVSSVATNLSIIYIGHCIPIYSFREENKDYIKITLDTLHTWETVISYYKNNK